MHNKLNGDLDVKIDEMHHVMLSLRASLDNRTVRVENPSSRVVSPIATSQLHQSPSSSNWPEKIDQSLLPTAHAKTPQETPELSDSEYSAYSPADTSKSDRSSSAYNREAMLIPPEHQYRISDVPPQYERSRQTSDTSSSSAYSPGTLSKPTSIGYKATPDGLFYPHTSPPSTTSPPTMDSEFPHSLSSAPSYTSSRDFTLNINYDGECGSSKSQETQIYRPTKGAATVGQHDAFKRSLFENAATLCEV